MPTTNTIHNASSSTEDAYVPEQLRAGDGDFNTRSVTVETGQVLAQYQVVARETTSGKFVAWDPASLDAGTKAAIGVTCYAVDATAADVAAAIYVAGFFNTDALVWGAATTAQKEAAFDGTDITHRTLV
jgi:hypothetical protein